MARGMRTTLRLHNKANTFRAHSCSVVLQPARGRPVLSKSPHRAGVRRVKGPSSHGTDTNQRYTAYKPTSWDLQRDIEETVAMLSKTATAKQPPIRDEIDLRFRASTAPGDSMAGSYYGMRPQIPPSAPSAPSALQNIKSQPALSYHYNTSEASTTRSSDFSAPLPPSSPDLPQPLKLTRKSPPPLAPQNSLPTVSSTLRPPAPPTEVYIVSRETTPAPPDNPTVSVPTMSTPEIQATRSRDPVSPPQTPPPLSFIAKTASRGPPPLSSSARAVTWGEGQKATESGGSLAAAAGPGLTKIPSDPMPAQISSPNTTNIYTLDNKLVMPTSPGLVSDAGTFPQPIPPRESSLVRDPGQSTSAVNKRLSLPPSAGSTSWQSQYSRPGIGGSSSLQSGHNSSQDASAEVAVRHGPPRPPKTPHTPEPRSSGPQTPPPSLPHHHVSGHQSLSREQHAPSPSPQSATGGANPVMSRAPSSLTASAQASGAPNLSSDVPYVLPAGHHPLSSHPVNLSRFSAPMPIKPSHQVSQDDTPQSSSLRNNRYSMLVNPSTTFSSSQPPPQPTPSPLGSETSIAVTNKRRSMVGPPPMPQPPSTDLPPKHPQPGGYAPNQPISNIDESVPPGLVPQRTASLRRTTPQPNRASPGVAEGPPPPQKYMAYAPPTSPPSAITGNSGQNTTAPPPQAPQFRTAPLQPPPFSQPSPQPTASPVPQQESKGSFFGIGKLFRSDSLRKGGSSSAGTKLQKNAAKSGGQLPPPGQQQSQPAGRTLQMNAQPPHQPVQPSHHMRQNSQPVQQYQPQHYPPFPQQQQQQQQWQGFNGGIPGVNSAAPVPGGQGGQGGPFFPNTGTGGGSGFGGVGGGGGGASHRPFSMMVAPTTGATRPPPPVTNSSYDGSGWGYEYQ